MKIFKYLIQNYIMLIMLIKSNKKDGRLNFSVCKDGLVLLRSFRNKRLRVIFNVTHGSESLEKFNSKFIKQKDSEKQMNIQECYSWLSVSQFYEELSDNRVLIILNAHENKEDPEASTHLLVLGYLVASVFFYHNEEGLKEDGLMTRMLSSLHGFLQATNVDKLSQEIKFKSGFAKQPYFMCLLKESFQEGKDTRAQFREMYRYREESSMINESTDVLMDYFSERSAITIQDLSKQKLFISRIQTLREQFIKTIIGRQIFNFQITGLTLQNLCFQLCQIFNENKQSLDLVKIYDKIICNQKTRVQDESIEKYMNLSKNLISELPYEPVELLETHHKIERYIIEQSIADALNCMNLGEYEQIYENLQTIMMNKLREISEINAQMMRGRSLKCYDLIESMDQLEHIAADFRSQTVSILMDFIHQKINGFIEETVKDFSTKDLLSRLIENYFQAVAAHWAEFAENKQKTIRNLNIKIERLEEECKMMEILRNQKFEEELSSSEQFKYKKLLSLNSKSESVKSKTEEIEEILQRNKYLEEQLCEKNSYIEQLTGVLEKFELEFNRKFYKPNFSKEISAMVSEISHQVNDIYGLCQNLKRTQKFYEEIKSEFEKKKKQFDNERAEEKKQLAIERSKLEKVIKEKNMLEDVVEEARSAIKVMKNVEEQFKESISKLENLSNRLGCLSADADTKLQNYKKALDLVVDYSKTGKSEKLKKFIKITNQDELKSMITQLLHR